jgi:hypothetical protein
MITGAAMIITTAMTITIMIELCLRRLLLGRAANSVRPLSPLAGRGSG